MDNRQFNVNGSGKETLRATLNLAFLQRWEGTKAAAYFIDKQKGLVLLWHNHKNSIAFPVNLNADAVTELVWNWLEASPEFEAEGWDANADHDGDNSLGWRVYCEDWGHVGKTDSGRYAIVAVKPAWLWYGK